MPKFDVCRSLHQEMSDRYQRLDAELAEAWVAFTSSFMSKACRQVSIRNAECYHSGDAYGSEAG